MSNPEENKPEVTPVVIGVNLPMLLKVISVVMVIVAATYIYWFNFQAEGMVPGDPESWGQFGDFFGGMLNPILSSFALVILAISLQASVHALNQNEVILGLTKKELEKTTKQIEQNNKALKKQVRAVQSSATLERLARQAERIYDRLETFKPAGRSQTKQAFIGVSINPDQSVERFNLNIWSAFDTIHPNFNKTANYRELNDTQIILLEVGDFGEFVRLIEMLNRICVRARGIQAVADNEFGKYYSEFIGRLCAGLVSKGYSVENDVEAINIRPRS